MPQMLQSATSHLHANIAVSHHPRHYLRAQLHNFRLLLEVMVLMMMTAMVMRRNKIEMTVMIH
jgi:hypothetical protein